MANTGASLALCAKRANMKVDTVTKWRLKHPDVDLQIRAARQEFIDKGEVLAQKAMLEAAANGQWRAGLAFMERTKPEVWARPEARPLEAEEEFKIEITEVIVDPEIDPAEIVPLSVLEQAEEEEDDDAGEAQE